MARVTDVSSMPPASSLRTLQTLLRQKLRITVVDTRIFIGMFAGTDKPLNILLVDTEEYWPGDSDGRFVSQILVPWRLITKVELLSGDGRSRSSIYI